MQQRKMIDVPVGTRVRSATRAPIDGTYKFVEHVKTSNCKPAAKDASIYLLRGQLLPRCKKCDQRGVWALKESKFEISPDEDHTPYVLREVRGDRSDRPYPSGTKK